MGLAKVRIGLAERFSALNPNHPALEGVQWHPSTPPAVQHACEKSDPELDLRDCHHATFMADLLAGKDGLIPGAQLCGIDLTDASQLVTKFGAAGDSHCHVINVSQQIPDDSGALGRQFSPTAATWSQLLFVVAANEKRVVQEALADLPTPPLSYQSTPSGFQQIIGVAPRLMDRSLLEKPQFSTHGSWVQIAAVGADVVGAGHEAGFNTGKGSSVASPQVTAAAALINAQATEAPATTKARLIYTVDWLSEVKTAANPIWGGWLNLRRAIRTREDLLVLPGSPHLEMEIEPVCGPEPSNPAPCTLSLDGGQSVPRGAPPEDLNHPEPISFDRLLRVSRSDETATTYTVVFIRGGVLRIQVGATITGTLRYRVTSALDTENPDPDAKVTRLTDEPLHTHEWSELLDYTARIEKVRTARKF